MFFNKDIKDVYKELNTSEDGLTLEKAESLFGEVGPNEIVEGKKKSKIVKFLNQFNDMMIIILIIVAVLMLIYGLLYSNDYTDSIVIAVVVLINAIMGFIQEEKAEVTLEGLKKYVSSTCKVKRNGKVELIDTKLLVPGDYIILEAGEKVPADARIISLSNLLVDESPLTGESNPVSKRANKINGTKLQIQDQLNMLFSGTNITNGRAEAIVTATGMYTELGKIAVSLNTPYEVKTPLELRIEEISKKLTFLVFLILIFIFIYSFIQKYEVMEIIMLCSSLAVAVIPEGLPAVITISLSNGAGALAKKKTIVRQMTAVETLGSTDVICSDKTGTITQNKMNVQKNIVLNQDWLDYVKILCNDAMYSKGKFVGDPTETCMLDELGYKKVSTIANDCPRLIDVPFDSDRKMMSTVNVIKGKTYLLVKGSLDSLMKKCSYMYKDNKKIKLTKEMQRVINEEEANMAENALRVISFAYKELKKVPKNIDEILKEEENLVLVGLSGMIDPPRVGVKESVLQAKNAGVRTIMITGDSLITAGAIAKRVGIVESRDECLLGSKLDEYTDEELIDVVNKYSVYARVSPIHKERIVKALQAQGKVVAMTGDGVNDAPAIKDAHVGIGMGITGTEVTKNVADIILLDDSFSTIVTAIEEGRRIFANIRNNVIYSLSSNFGELFTILIAMFTGTTILLPIHILFIDLVTDSIPSICLSFEPSEKGIMNKPPRGIDKPMFTPFAISNIVSSAIVETVAVCITFFMVKNSYNAEVAMSCALLTLVMQEIIYAITCRNLKQFVFKQGLFSNKQFNIGIFIILLVEAIFFLTPLRQFIGIVKLPISLMLIIIICNMVVFFIYELLKPVLLGLFDD